MKIIMTLICCLIISGMMLFATGCKKAETPEKSEEKTSLTSPEKPAFNPDEPAPVPEGTPKY